MKDMVSIIIPVYNRQDVIEECIASILTQSYQNFEIVLIDDGSSDRTLEICKSLAQDEPRIKLLAGEHAGVSAARNKGLDCAGGEYVFFVDSDDVIHPQLLEALVSGLKNSDAAIAGTGIWNVLDKYWDRVLGMIERDPGPSEITNQTHEETLKAVFTTTSPINLIGGVMMRRDYIGQTRFRTDLYISEDFQFVYDNLIKGANTVFLKQKWYYCRIHERNSSHDTSFSGFWTRFYRRELVWTSEEAFCRQEYANIQKREAFGIFVKCLRNNPLGSEDTKKICRVMKDYRKTLLPAMTFSGKLRYHLYVYLPFTYMIVFKLRKK